MSTKVLNKLVNICSTLSGDEVSSGTSSSEYITKDEIFDLIYPVGTILTMDGSILSSPTLVNIPGSWAMLDTFEITSTMNNTHTATRWKRTE